MKIVFPLFMILAFVLSTSAQKTDDVLATATGHTFRLTDLSAETQKDVANLPATIPKGRMSLLEQLVNQKMLALEARSRGVSTGKLVWDERAKAPAPTEADIKKVYDENQARLGGATIDQVRPQIVAYLKQAAGQKQIMALVDQLKAKYKPVNGKDVNAAGLLPTDVVATVNGQPITDRDFEDYVRIPLWEARGELADNIEDELHQRIYDTLVADEAKAQGIDSGTLIAREVTNKMKDFSDAERISLNNAFAERLYAKYQVKVMYAEPEPPAENVTPDDDPATGPVNAPVTIIMFSDFQCSACSGTHPLLKQAMAAYPGKIRFVVRDFPLEAIHENGFQAARAAGAANLQGKFFDYIEILYKNQNALDVASLKKYAGQIGLNVQQFEVDFNSEKVAAEVRKDMADGEALNIGSTPTIFVNRKRVRNLSVEGFKAAIDKALAGK